MPSTINATSTSSGLISSADSSGVLALQTSGTTAMTITTAQAVGIGTTNPLGQLSVKGANGIYAERSNDTDSMIVKYDGITQYANATGAGNYNTLAFNQSNNTATVERMRIAANGNVLIGTTNNDCRLNAVDSGVVSRIIRAEASNGSFTGSLYEGYGARTSTNGSYQLIQVLNGNGTGLFQVLDSGNAQNTNNSYGAYSDVKLKENIVDATPKLEDLCKVKIRNYNLKNKPEEKQIGVVAQELEKVFAGLIEETADKDKEGNDLGTTTKSVKYSVFVPMLIKALQELNAKVDAQALEIQALKGVA